MHADRSAVGGTSGWMRVAMVVDGERVGVIAARPGAGPEVAVTDRGVLRALPSQAALALHGVSASHAAVQLRGRGEQLHAVTTRHGMDLAGRDAELAEKQRQLIAAMQAQVRSDERHRIARELHDSVTQSVLSAGLTIEACRAELEAIGGQAMEIAKRLASARDLTRHAVGQLRTAIYELHTADEPACPLPAKLQQLSSMHHPTGLDVKVMLEGPPVPLPCSVERSLLRWTGEALFNAAAHGEATRAVIRLRYRADAVALSVSDNGSGDPAQLRRALRLACAADLSGWHRGLANMATMARELGGTLSIRRSRSGGVSIRLDIPAPMAGRSEPGRGARGLRAVSEGRE